MTNVSKRQTSMDELMNIATCGCEACASCTRSHPSKARPEASSHSVEPVFDHKSLLAVIEPGTLVIRVLLTACQVELSLSLFHPLHSQT